MKIVVYILEAAIAFVLPFILGNYFCKKSGCGIKNMWHGICVYVLFITVGNTAVNVVIGDISNIWLYAAVKGFIVAALAALGRVIWFSKVMKANQKREDGLLFGMGFGAARLIFTYGLSGLGYAIFLIVISAMDTSGIPAVFEDTVTLINETSLYSVFLDILRMALFFVLETGVSVVFHAAVNGKVNKGFAVLSAILHMLCYGAAVLEFAHILRIVIIAVLVICSMGIASYTYKKYE